MAYKSYDDCWRRASKYGYHEGRIIDFIVVIIMLLAIVGGFYLSELISNISFLIMGYDIFSILCWSLFILLLVIVIIYAWEISKKPTEEIIVNCISEYYTPVNNPEEFNDFKWMIDANAGVVIEYNWVKWLIIPKDDLIYILTPYRGIYTDLHVKCKMIPYNETIYRLTQNFKKTFKGHSLLFQEFIYDYHQITPLLHGMPIRYHKGFSYVCSSEETCRIAQQIIEKLRGFQLIHGISLTGLYSHRYLGICAKTPRSRDEFESLLSYASDLRSMLSSDK